MTLALVAALVLTADAAAYMPGDPSPEPERIGDVFLKPEETRPIRSPDLWVLGWSKNGKFAYVLTDDTSAPGHRLYQFVLMDLRTSLPVTSANATAPRDSPPTIVQMLEKKKAFLAALNANAIVPDPDAELIWAPVKVGSSTADFSLEKAPASEPDELGRPRVGKWAVTLKGDKGKKKVFEASREGTGPDVGPLQVGYLGYFRSPHEARIAIVLGEEYRVFEDHLVVEGVTRLLFRVIGADLTTGFKK